MSDERRYPIERPPADEADPRFTFGLAMDVADLLEQRGYPRPTDLDLVRLQGFLFRFIYRSEGSNE